MTGVGSFMLLREFPPAPSYVPIANRLQILHIRPQTVMSSTHRRDRIDIYQKKPPDLDGISEIGWAFECFSSDLI